MAEAMMTEQPPAGARLWRTEFLATLLLGLAAVGAGWTAYQAARWGGEQTFTLDQAGRIRRKATVTQNRAYLIRAVDLGLFVNYLQAISQNNTALASFLLGHFPPRLRTATTAWLATGPFKNLNAPLSPFQMKQYQVEEDQETARLEGEAHEITTKARHANELSDDYVLITVPFAIVSLFSGLSSKFSSPGIRTAIVTMACAVFVAAALTLAFMPVH